MALFKADIETTEHHVKELGYCIAARQPEVVAFAAPIQIGSQIYAGNVSVSSDEEIGKLTTVLAPILIKIKAAMDAELQS